MSKGLAAALGRTNPGTSEREKIEAKETLADIDRDSWEICEEFPDHESIRRLKFLRLMSHAARWLPLYVLSPLIPAIERALEQVQQGLVPMPEQPSPPNGNGQGLPRGTDTSQTQTLPQAGSTPQQQSSPQQTLPPTDQQVAKAAEYDKLGPEVVSFLRSLQGYTLPLNAGPADAFKAFAKQFKDNSTTDASDARIIRNEVKKIVENILHPAIQECTPTVDTELAAAKVFDGVRGKMLEAKIPDATKARRIMPDTARGKFNEALHKLDALTKK
jgi:hypothetical protein